jgi:glyoxylase-like metal-dependent hydrolase (beta-lactamase superfamily II)
MGFANAFILDSGPELVMVDAGFPGKASIALDAIRQLGRSPRDLKHLVFTHGHPDHIGSAAALVRETGATTYMHSVDAPIAESGGPFRPMTAAPGLLHKVMYRLFWHPGERMEPVRIDKPLIDGETLPIAGGLTVIHSPGHCAGHVSLLWRGARMLIVGDVCMNLVGLGDPVGFEDVEEGRRSQRKLASLSFEAGCFGHGLPIVSGAAERFRRAWGLPGERCVRQTELAAGNRH